MASERVSFNEIKALMTEANFLGADVRIPRPQDRPLVILVYEAFDEKNPRTYRFKSLKGAKEWLLNFCNDLKAYQKS